MDEDEVVVASFTRANSTRPSFASCPQATARWHVSLLASFRSTTIPPPPPPADKTSTPPAHNDEEDTSQEGEVVIEDEERGGDAKGESRAAVGGCIPLSQ
jgi:hypothetical protein